MTLFRGVIWKSPTEEAQRGHPDNDEADDEWMISCHLLGVFN